MLRTLDRYVIREVLPPITLSLLILTFLLVLPPVMENLERLLAKGVGWMTAAQIIWTLVPQALGLTIPMAVLIGLLIGLGRLSTDREAVALLACGVSPYRLLRPVGAVGVISAAATLYVMLVAHPDANQRFREITFDVISKRVESDIRPRVFFEDFPGWVLYARDEPDPGIPGWKDMLVAETRKPGGKVYFARRGRLRLNREQRQVHLILEDTTSYSVSEPGQPDSGRFPGELTMALNPDEVFRNIQLQRGPNEKRIPELQAEAQNKIKNGISPHPEIIALQQKFSFPMACLVFAITALALGLTVAREGKLAGFVVGVVVIFGYYIVMHVAESMVKGHYANPDQVAGGGRFLLAHMARWVPNVAVGLFGIGALIWRARYTEGRFPIRIPFHRVKGLTLWRRQAASGVGERTSQSTSQTPVRATGRSPRAVVVIRIPRLQVWMPSLIDRYISRLYVRVVALSFMALLGLFYISTFIDRSDKILKGQATGMQVVELLFYQTPQFVYYVIPIAALLSALVTFGLLSRSSELTVLKACGVSLYRAAVSVLLLSLLLSGVLFSLEQKVLAYANRRADAVDSRIRGRQPRTLDTLNRRWVVAKDGDIYHFTHFDPDNDEIFGLVIYQPNLESWTLSSITFVERATFRGEWRTAKGWIQTFAGKQEWTPIADYPLAGLETPDYFKTEQPLAEMMTVAQLKRYIDDLSASGFNVVPLAVDLQRKLAFPFVTFVMTVLAVPFGVSTGKRGTLYGIGLGIVLALSYWITSSAFVAIGKGGLLAPELAGWTPNIIVVGVGLYLFLRVRT